MNWEFTGNHYLAWPCIDPASGAIHEANVLHRGMASLVSWTGDPDGSPEASPWLRIGVSIDGVAVPLESLRWERLDRWIPRFTVRSADGTRVTVTYCAPGGFDPLAAGGSISVQVENAGRDAKVRVWLDGDWRWVLRTMATTRPLRASRCLCIMAPGTVALEAGEIPGGLALAIQSDGADRFTEWALGDDALSPGRVGAEICAPNGESIRFRVGSERVVAAGRRSSFSFTFGAAQERDGATAVTSRLSAIGADDLLRRARLDLASLNRATDDSVARDLVARNLIFHHYWAAARAVDDDRLYPVMSRSREHGECAVYGEREALAWSLPAYAMTDSMIARELLMRVLEIQSDRPGNHRRYVDGGMLDAGFSLGRVCDYAIAVERYVELARDGAFADEPLVQQLFREIEELAWSRLHEEIFLGSTEVLPGGQTADYPFCAFDNVLLWKLCRIHDRFRRIEPGEARSRLAGGDEEIEAAFWQRFNTDVDGLPVIAYEVDLQGHAAIYDDPAGSLRLLPSLGFCSADDPIWMNTMEMLHSRGYPLWLGDRKYPGFAGRSRPREARFAALCADLLTGRRESALERVRALDLPGGVACTAWDPDSGRAVTGPYAASEAGFLVWAMLASDNGAG